MLEKITVDGQIFTNNYENGLTAQQVYEDWVLRDLKPTTQEIREAELEIKLIKFLTELEVF